MQELVLRDDGSGNPEASSDYNSTMVRLEALVKGVVTRAQRARRAETSSDAKEPVSSSPSSRESRDNISYLEQQVRRLKKETRDVFLRGTQFFEFSEGGDLFKSESPKNYHQYMRIPLSWYQEIERSHYNNTVPYHDAIQILGYIVLCYRLDRMIPQLLLRIRPQEIQSFLGIKEDRMRRAFRHLEDDKLIERIVFKGMVPWYDRDDRTSGSYRFIIPYPDRLRAITYDISARFTRLPGKEDT